MQSSLLKIAVTGPNGRLGSELVKQGCIPLMADICSVIKTRAAIDDIKPDLIINCAAYTDVDGCERNPLKACKVNIAGVYSLSQAFPGKIIQISTDFVFDGLDGPYDENAKPNPISIYGLSKLGGELIIKNRQNPKDLIIRITSPFGVSSKSTIVQKIVDRLRNSQPLAFPPDLISSPGYLPHLARGILEAVYLTGILNIAGSRVMPLKKFAQEIAKIWGFDPDVIKDGYEVGLAPRPLRGGLEVHKASQNNIFIGNPITGLEEMHALETMAAG